jgi:hypothetical protein
MYQNEMSARVLIEDRHRELRHRSKHRSRPPGPVRRWIRRDR